jgi:hypothetical protein
MGPAYANPRRLPGGLRGDRGRGERSLRPCRFTKGGPERIILTYAGVPAALHRCQGWAVSIIRLASAVRTNEAMAGSASSPVRPRRHQSALAIICLVGVEAGRHRIGGNAPVTRTLRFRSQNKASRAQWAGPVPQCVLLRELPPWRTRRPGSKLSARSVPPSAGPAFNALHPAFDLPIEEARGLAKMRELLTSRWSNLRNPSCHSLPWIAQHRRPEPPSLIWTCWRAYSTWRV